jgi:thiol-disulfide isomerase/thioredoxin
MNHKKILIGFIIAFILGLNIYNIPLNNRDTFDETALTPDPAITTFDFSEMNRVVNESLTSPVNFNDYNYVLITFWASWCPSCKRENKLFNELLKTYGDDLLIIGISVDQSADAMADYLAAHPLSFPVFQMNASVAELVDDIVAVPTHYVIETATGRFKKSLGMMNETDIKNVMKGVL